MGDKHEYNIKVRYSEIDGMKIVHNSIYQIYFEEARIDLVEKEKYPYSQIENDGLMFPISEVQIKYKNSIFYGETVKVILTCAYIKNYSIKFNYKIIKDNNETACEGYTIHACVDFNTKEFAPVSDRLKEIFTRYLE